MYAFIGIELLVSFNLLRILHLIFPWDLAHIRRLMSLFVDL
jgi:hypothetical protein